MSETEAAQLIQDPRAPLPMELQEKWNKAYQERKEKEELLRKQHELSKVVSVFQSEWLSKTEAEMAKYNKELSSLGQDQNKKTALQGLLEIMSNKLRMFHAKEGTLRLEAAVVERRKLCLRLGLLTRPSMERVVDVVSPLPVDTDESPSDEDEFVTPPPTPTYVPRYGDSSVLEDYTSPELWGGLIPPTPKGKQIKRKRNSQPAISSGQKKLTTYFSS